VNNPSLEELVDPHGHPVYWQDLIDAVGDPAARASL
jgi:hypothetical protein